MAAPKLCSVPEIDSFTRYNKNALMMISMMPPKKTLGDATHGVESDSSADPITGIKSAKPENNAK